MPAIYQAYTFSLGNDSISFACPPGLECYVAFSSMHVSTTGDTTTLRTTNLEDSIRQAVHARSTPEWRYYSGNFWSNINLLLSDQSPTNSSEVDIYLDKWRQIATMRKVLEGGVGNSRWRSFGVVHEYYANKALNALDRINVGRLDPFLYFREMLEGYLEHAETRIQRRTQSIDSLYTSESMLGANRSCPRMPRLPDGARGW
jgi:hypothetical protein